MAAMTFEDARQAIYSKFKTGWDANYPLVPVSYKNRDRVDLLQQKDPFVSIAVEFVDGEQASIELNSVTRYHGVIHFGCYVREFEGVATVNAHLQYLATLFKSATFSGLVLLGAKPAGSKTFEGWMCEMLRVPFWFDAIP